MFTNTEPTVVKKEGGDAAKPDFSEEGRIENLKNRYTSLTEQGENMIWLDSSRRKYFEDRRDWIDYASSYLEEIKRDNKPNLMNYRWGDVKLWLDDIEQQLSAEAAERKGQRDWKRMSIIIAAVYLVLIFFAIPRFDSSADVFGIPFQIIVWSAIGSFAAILYRFYKSPPRVNFEIEFRWLIARPIIGIIMGTLVYLALVAGLIVFTPAQSGATSAIDIQKSGQLAQYWIVAFLGGFSDKFYEKIIEWLVGRLSFENESDHQPAPTNGGNGAIVPAATQEQPAPETSQPENVPESSPEETIQPGPASTDPVEN